MPDRIIPASQLQKISPEIQERLRRAAIPPEFKETVLQLTALADEGERPETEGTEAAAEERPPLPKPAILQVPVQAELIPKAELPTAQAETAGGVHYLSDLRLDLSGVAHITPGLRELNNTALAALVYNQLAFWGGEGESGQISDEDETVPEQAQTCRVCRLVVLIGQMNKKTGTMTDSAIEGARKWALKRASEQPKECFLLWKTPSDDAPFINIYAQDITGGNPGKQTRYTKTGGLYTTKFSKMLGEFAEGKGRIEELVIFHHGAKVKEEKVVLRLGEILASLLKIPVCRLVYWSCNAAVELDTSRGSTTDLLMREFAWLSQNQRCGCRGLVELIKPTAGKCSLQDQAGDQVLATGDGKVTRIRWGYVQAGKPPRPFGPRPDPNDPHPFLNPQPDKPEDVDGSKVKVLGTPVAKKQ